MYGAGGQKRVPEQFIKDLRIPLPPLDEQYAIARFLDERTALIDDLIAKKERLLELLAEQRTAIITSAVTRGLAPTVSMRDSDVPWLGEVPKHWEVKQLRYCFDNLNNRRIPIAAEERKSLERTYPYYGASGIIDYVDEYIFDEPLILVAEDGANLLSRSTPLAFLATGKYWVNNHAHILRPLNPHLSYWAHLLLIIDYTPWVTGSAQPKLTKESLNGVFLPYPPEEEQASIGIFLDEKLKSLAEIRRPIEQVIKRLIDYRSALITAAVTGQIDVRVHQFEEEFA
jgi:type I restriction enzyme, S subunit